MATREAIQYFYPQGFWGGYVRWFEPCINSRTGDALIQNVKRGLQGDQKSLLAALFILQSTHTKKLNKRGAKPPYPDVLCHPTEEAKRAVKLLSNT